MQNSGNVTTLHPGVQSDQGQHGYTGRGIANKIHGGGGGTPVDSETKNYLDAKVDAVKAQNDARFSEVLAKIDVLKVDMDSKPLPPSIWQIAGVVAAGIGAVVAIAAFSYDRFDGGVGASAIVNQAVQELSASQDERDQVQDDRLTQILDVLRSLNDKPKTGPSEQN